MSMEKMESKELLVSQYSGASVRSASITVYCGLQYPSDTQGVDVSGDPLEWAVGLLCFHCSVCKASRWMGLCGPRETFSSPVMFVIWRP